MMNYYLNNKCFICISLTVTIVTRRTILVALVVQGFRSLEVDLNTR